MKTFVNFLDIVHLIYGLRNSITHLTLGYTLLDFWLCSSLRWKGSIRRVGLGNILLFLCQLCTIANSYCSNFWNQVRVF